jgi:hypothetical protein
MPNDLNAEIAILLSSPDISDSEKNLLQAVNTSLHDYDNMLNGLDQLHYLSVGLSASRCIDKAIGGNYQGIDEILDFPCGSGRVLRFLRAMFPASTITASEIDTEMLDFCMKNFSAESFISKPNFGDLFLKKVMILSGAGHFLLILMNLLPSLFLIFSSVISLIAVFVFLQPMANYLLIGCVRA